MSGAVLMAAIGEIDDKYIAECVNTNHRANAARKHIKRAVAAAACLCAILSVAAIWFVYADDSSSISHDHEHIIWGTSLLGQYGEVDGDLSNAETGKILVSVSLEDAFLRSESEDNVFAIQVMEKNGVEKSEIYSRFILKQKWEEEDYLENGLVFATREQIENLHCPSDMAIVLRLAEKEESDIVLSKEDLGAITSDTVTATVWLNDHEELGKALSELEEAEGDGFSQELYEQRIAAIEAVVNGVTDRVLSDHGISPERVTHRGALLSYFTVELSGETLKGLLEDERVGTITVHGDGGDRVSSFW